MKKTGLFARVGTTILVVAALAACNQGGNGNDSREDNESRAEGEGGDATAFKMEQGQWETTLEITKANLEGAPEDMQREMREGRKETQSNCLPISFSMDELRLRNMRFDIPPGGNCTIEEISSAGGKMRSKLSCRGLPQEISFEMESDGTYDERSVESTFRAEGSMQGGRRGTVEGRMTARRLGDCERSSPPMMTPPAYSPGGNMGTSNMSGSDDMMMMNKM